MSLGAPNLEDAGPTLRYVFAHLYMRDAIFKIGVWGALFGPDGAEYLQGMWSRCAEQFPESERVSSEGLDLGAVDRGADWLVLPIVFPRPLVGLEAHFGAIAVRPGRRKRFFGSEPPIVRYLLLERGVEESDSAGTNTVLGEWTLIAHMNHGRGPATTTFAEFVDGVKKLL